MRLVTLPTNMSGPLKLNSNGQLPTKAFVSWQPQGVYVVGTPYQTLLPYNQKKKTAGLRNALTSRTLFPRMSFVLD